MRTKDGRGIVVSYPRSGAHNLAAVLIRHFGEDWNKWNVNGSTQWFETPWCSIVHDTDGKMKLWDPDDPPLVQVRDDVDVIWSHVQVRHEADEVIEPTESEVRSCMEELRKHRESYRDCPKVRSESLFAADMASWRRMFDYLGLEMDPSRLREAVEYCKPTEMIRRGEDPRWLRRSMLTPEYKAARESFRLRYFPCD